jgi:tetratricopeptide (TPR) repeat protein
MRLLSPSIVMLSLSGLVAAQSNETQSFYAASQMRHMEGNNHSVETPLTGQLDARGLADLNRLRVQICDIGGRHVIAETFPDLYGNFELRAPAGTYEIRVLSLHGNVIHQETIILPAPDSHVLKLSSAERVSPGFRQISLQRLQHKVPKAAVKAYRAAHEASAKGRTNEAISALTRAVSVDPDYFEAWNNLGVQHLREGHAAAAAQCFEQAIRLDSADPLVETNYAFALLLLKRFPEAEQAARAGIRADADSPRARFYLAVSLLEQRKPTQEALFHLERASGAFEPARRLKEKLTNEANSAAR